MIKPTAETILPTNYGNFTMQSYTADTIENPTLVLSVGLDQQKIPIVRIHSECITGEIFGSMKCDCAKQLEVSMAAIQDHGCGVLVYLRQEGRGIGIENKLKAYALQDQGLDTIDANIALGLPVDSRDYSSAIEILEYLGVTCCELLTNNPDKVRSIQASSISLSKTSPLKVESLHPACATYMKTKQVRMAHSI